MCSVAINIPNLECLTIHFNIMIPYYIEVSAMNTTETIEILDKIDIINEKIISSEPYQNFIRQSVTLEHDEVAQALIYKFNNLKIEFEEVSRFGKYHPDFSTKRRALNQAKKSLDMQDSVLEYRRAEYKLQEMLDEVLYEAGICISQHVNIVSDNPFFNASSGGCAAGGSCGCSA